MTTVKPGFESGLESRSDSASAGETIEVEVAFALPDQQLLVSLEVKAGCSAQQAFELSGICEQFPDYDFTSLDMGLFSRPLDGKILPLPTDYVLEAGDRVEVYRPLSHDPKLARLERVRNEQRNLRKERDKLNKEKKNKRQQRKEER